MKLPPQSKDAEMMVLGAMMNSINALNTACDMLSEDDFYFSEHRTLFQCMALLRKQDKAVDTLIVAERLKNEGLLEGVGGISYLAVLSDYAVTSSYIEEHSEIVIGKSTLRKVIFAAQDVEKKAIEEKSDALDILEDASKAFFNISQRSRKASYKTSKRWVEGPDGIENKPFMEWLTEKQEEFLKNGNQENIIAGMPTHFKDLDKMINGMGRGHLLILAARPGMGKTALALNIAANVAIKNNVAVGIFSLEMPSDELMLRLISSASLVDFNKIKIGDISGMEYQKLLTASHQIKEKRILFDDQGGIKIGDLKARARRMKESDNIEFLMIDYLQLINGSGSKASSESRQVLVSEISKEIKNLAKELEIPILCLSQLSRGPEGRDDKMPLLSDLRESGAIEQDADIVMMINRPDYYAPDKTPGLTQVKVAKNRHGATGIINLNFDKPHFLFNDCARFEMPSKDELEERHNERVKRQADEDFRHFGG